MIGPAGSGFPTPPGLGSRPRCSISCNTDVHGGASRPSSFGETPTGTPPGFALAEHRGRGAADAHDTRSLALGEEPRC